MLAIGESDRIQSPQTGKTIGHGYLSHKFTLLIISMDNRQMVCPNWYRTDHI